jgi:predicted TIM-barrel fold metal-dependent hydrolase
MISRREWMLGAFAAAHGWTAQAKEMQRMASALVSAPSGPGLIESHIHLFAGDLARFPYNAASYAPHPEPVEEYVKYVPHAHIAHAVIVHPEPYQDDHRYLEYAFAHEPLPGFFKGTGLFDPIDPETPQRMQMLVRRNPGRIVALRIHETHAAGTPSTTGGLIRDRDLRDPQMAVTWRAAHELGLAIQVHCIPYYAAAIGELASKFPQTPVIIDHLARPGEGTPEEYKEVLKLAGIPRVYMKYTKTGVASASKQPFPHQDAKPLVRRVYQAFGPDKIIWGELGVNMTEFQQAAQLLDLMIDTGSPSERARIQGLNAKKLFAFS